jgi:hypothetical protein
MAKKLASDATLFAVTVALIGLGLVTVWSASSALAEEALQTMTSPSPRSAAVTAKSERSDESFLAMGPRRGPVRTPVRG